MKHYVDKRGYHYYSPKEKKFIHDDLFHVNFTVKGYSDWVWTDSAGYIKVENDKIVSFIKDEKVKSCYRHIPKKYVGFTHVFYYCEVCDKKLSDGDEEPPGFNWNGLF